MRHRPSRLDHGTASARRWMAAAVAIATVAFGCSDAGPANGDAAPDERGASEPTVVSPAPRPGWPAGDDALQRRVLDELAAFVDWLGDERGYIGEVGWPNDESTEQWNALADVWFDAADASDLMVTMWATGEWWGSYDMLVYANEGSTIGRPTPPAEVLERHLGDGEPDRGVNVNGVEFGIDANLGTGTGGSFSNERRGAVDDDYHYESQDSFDYLALRGVELVRLPFRWERMQPTPGGPLDDAEVERFAEHLRRAERAGLQAIPTVMNYGAYWMQDDPSGRGERVPIGADEVPVEQLADLWSRLAVAFGGHDNVLGWGLMNEPTDMPGGARTWEAASQAAVDAIRATGDRRLVLVPGYEFSTAPRFPATHPDGPWIDDPAAHVRYEAHHYFDADNSGDYRSYDTELSDAEERGW